VALFTATSPRTGDAPLTVSFDGTLSTGDPSGYQWDFDGDGIVDSTDPMPTHTYPTAGTYTVTLTVVNLTGVDVEQKVGYVVVTSPPTPTPTGPTPTPTVAPTPACAYPPNVIGQTPNNAAIMLSDAGFKNFKQYGDLTKGNKGKIQAQNPDHTQCLALTTLIVTHYRPN
jgi:PKD repeat protein